MLSGRAIITGIRTSRNHSTENQNWELRAIQYCEAEKINCGYAFNQSYFHQQPNGVRRCAFRFFSLRLLTSLAHKHSSLVGLGENRGNTYLGFPPYQTLAVDDYCTHGSKALRTNIRALSAIEDDTSNGYSKRFHGSYYTTRTRNPKLLDLRTKASGKFKVVRNLDVRVASL